MFVQAPLCETLAKSCAADFFSFIADEEFRWADLSPVQYENWAEGEPNGNASESGCVRMYTSNGIEDGIWDDYFCDYFNQFVCKTPKGNG